MKSILPPVLSRRYLACSQSRFRSFPRMFFSVAARWSPPVDWRDLIWSSVILIKRERSVEFPQRQTKEKIRKLQRNWWTVFWPWVSSRNIRRSASSFSAGESFSEILNGSAKRKDNSKTASFERENVSHCPRISRRHKHDYMRTPFVDKKRRSHSRTYWHWSTREVYDICRLLRKAKVHSWNPCLRVHNVILKPITVYKINHLENTLQFLYSKAQHRLRRRLW